MTILQRLPIFTAALLLMNGCVHSQANFAVLTDANRWPRATTVFADADTFAHQRGFVLDDIEVMNGVKKVYYHRNANYLSIEHYTDSRRVDFNIVGSVDPYHQDVANRFSRDFTKRYSSEYGGAIVSSK